MDVRLELSEKYQTPHAVIHTHAITPEVQRALDYLRLQPSPLTAQKDDTTVILKPREVYLIRIEGSKTIIYTQREHYHTKKRLYQLVDQLGEDFLQISKQTVVNMAHIHSVEASFNGTLLLKMKNNLTDYVSRKYLPQFKAYLGL
ncbi:MAG: LytTR family DNA-binding domain-containing protein [Tissierellia bacterium]|nr:LytTR family DNA-binding domain-containing protein [Tissierellia bacterium]